MTYISQDVWDQSERANISHADMIGHFTLELINFPQAKFYHVFPLFLFIKRRFILANFRSACNTSLSLFLSLSLSLSLSLDWNSPISNLENVRSLENFRRSRSSCHRHGAGDNRLQVSNSAPCFDGNTFTLGGFSLSSYLSIFHNQTICVFV